MIYIKFNVRNPWSDRWSSGQSYSGEISEHKFWELQFMKTADLICFELSYSINQDHAGFNIELGLAGYSVSFSVYDNRHWDWENKTWLTGAE